jgi:Fe-S-cluster containining protein
MPKLTQKQESDSCLACGECCKRYSITILPEEAQLIAKKLRISKKKFLETHCELFVKVYPKTTPGILTFPTTFFPKKIGEMLLSDLNIVPAGFFVLPQIALKRKEGICRYLNKNNTCQIYNERPFPCELFPFMVVPGYEEQYPFCELFKKSNKTLPRKSKQFSKKIKVYFKQIDEKGFVKVWRNVPKKGKFFLNELLLGEITSLQLEKMMKIKMVQKPIHRKGK